MTASSVLTCAGVPITSCNAQAAARDVVRLAANPPRSGADIHLCNAYTLALADQEPAYRTMLSQATRNFPDGKALVWASQLLYPSAKPCRERVSGTELFLDVVNLGQGLGLKHFLLGSTPEVLSRLVAELRCRFPGVLIVGTESPPFRDITEHETEEQKVAIVASGANIVWLGLGTPKQDWEAARLASEVPAVFCAVGAAFDFIAGTKRRAPLWMQRAGLEWVFRLLEEPTRLWRRYVFGNARFIRTVYRARRLNSKEPTAKSISELDLPSGSDT